MISGGHLASCRDAIGSFRVRKPYCPVIQIKLILLQGRQLFVDPKTGFCDDPDDIAQVFRRAELDPVRSDQVM
jgi:hypothetical protein